MSDGFGFQGGQIPGRAIANHHFVIFADDILMHPLSLPRFIAKGWRYLHRLRGTAASHLNHSFSNEAVRAAMSGTLLYTGIPPDKMPGAVQTG